MLRACLAVVVCGTCLVGVSPARGETVTLYQFVGRLEGSGPNGFGLPGDGLPGGEDDAFSVVAAVELGTPDEGLLAEVAIYAIERFNLVIEGFGTFTEDHLAPGASPFLVFFDDALGFGPGVPGDLLRLTGLTLEREDPGTPGTVLTATFGLDAFVPPGTFSPGGVALTPTPQVGGVDAVAAIDTLGQSFLHALATTPAGTRVLVGVASIPEPGTLVLALGGGFALCVVHRRRRRK
ncbi:MAG: PEP-CTERM sorting domain-containing protein [Planctomycetota bacterium]